MQSSDQVSEGSGNSLVDHQAYLCPSKPATATPYEKEVTLLTPVLIGNKNLPSSFAKRKVKYLTGSLLHA
jgi:hypothetical protein